MGIIIIDHVYYFSMNLAGLQNLRTVSSQVVLQDIELNPSLVEQYSLFKYCWNPDQFQETDPIHYKLVRVPPEILPNKFQYRLLTTRLGVYKTNQEGEDLLNVASYIDRLRQYYSNIINDNINNISVDNLPVWLACVVYYWIYKYKTEYTIDQIRNLDLNNNLSRSFAYISLKQQLSTYLESMYVSNLP